jgi:RHS repeat-associated protein
MLTLVKTSGTQTPETHFGEGIIRGTQVMYFENDHLGSIRTVLNTAGTVIERNDYYPFGMRHANASHVVTANNRYKFNGKEDQTVGALGLLDYGARMYDAQIGRWLTVDPMADSYYSVSPYAYCADNPVRFIDPNGMFFDDYFINENEKRIAIHKQPGKIDRIFDKDNPEGLEVEKGSFDLEEYLEKGYKVETFIPVGMAMTDFVASNVIGGAIFSKIGGLVSKGISSLRAARVAKTVESARVGFIVEKVGVANSRALGVAGEQAVGITGSKTAITVGGRVRIPDRLTATTLEEVKNVKSLSFTKQLRDFRTYSQQNELQMILYTRPNTVLSGPLQQQIQSGNIILKTIP